MSSGFKITGNSSPLISRRDGGSHAGSSLARFKRGRKVGDLVRGVFLRLEPLSPGTAWVNLEGEELLAALPPELEGLAKKLVREWVHNGALSPEAERRFPLRHGDQCYFILESIEPEPVLHMLHLMPGASSELIQSSVESARLKALWRSLILLPPAQLASRYVSSRSSLDKLLHSHLWGKEASPVSAPLADLPEGFAALASSGAGYADYVNFIINDTTAAELYVDMSMCRAAFVRSLAPAGVLSLNYMPWLNPALRKLEVAISREVDGGHGFLMQGQLPDGNYLRLEGSLAPCRVRRRSLLPAGSQDLPVLLLGASPMPHNSFSRRA